MSQLDLRGTVYYRPGPWGTLVPASGVELSVWDQDSSNADDRIWSGSSGRDGKFSGRSSDWRDRVNVTVSTRFGSYTQQVDDMSDAMTLYVVATQRIGNRTNRVSLPYVPPPPGFPNPPLVLTWGPPGYVDLHFGANRVASRHQFVDALQSIVDDTAAGRVGIRREFRLYGDQLITLRRAMRRLEPDMRNIESLITAWLQATQPPPVNVLNSGLRARLNSGVSANASLRAGVTNAGAGASSEAQARWSQVRAALEAFVQSLATVAMSEAARCDIAVAGKSTTWAVVNAICAVIIAVVIAVIVSTLAITSGGVVVAAIVAAIISAVATILLNLPALLRACGADDAAGTLENWNQQNTWFACMLMVVMIFCALVILLAAAPLAGWSWLVEEVQSAAGEAGLRFVLER
ncbi:MAG: hypothetical protein KF778_13885 [Rhodocyclaceae bacterium]|nr:hypothetical protein [Rhodocyclaceae bacterium]